MKAAARERAGQLEHRRRPDGTPAGADRYGADLPCGQPAAHDRQRAGRASRSWCIRPGARRLCRSGTQLVASLAQGFTQGIPDFLSNALPQLLAVHRETCGPTPVSSWTPAWTSSPSWPNGLIAGLPDLIAYVPDIIINICGIINDNMPKLLAAGRVHSSCS